MVTDVALRRRGLAGEDATTRLEREALGGPERRHGVDEFQRRFAKVVNYGLAYGMEAYGLGQRLDIPTDQAREILDAYFAAFPNVAGYMKETVREAKSRGYTTTIFGRRRQLPELSSDNFRIRQMGERMAQNAPVQGSAADIFRKYLTPEIPLAASEMRGDARTTIDGMIDVTIEAPDGTSARPKLPSASVTSASSVGLPRLSRISRAWILAMVVIDFACVGRV